MGKTGKRLANTLFRIYGGAAGYIPGVDGGNVSVDLKYNNATEEERDFADKLMKKYKDLLEGITILPQFKEEDGKLFAAAYDGETELCICINDLETCYKCENKEDCENCTKEF